MGRERGQKDCALLSILFLRRDEDEFVPEHGNQEPIDLPHGEEPVGLCEKELIGLWAQYNRRGLGSEAYAEDRPELFIAPPKQLDRVAPKIEGMAQQGKSGQWWRRGEQIAPLLIY